MTLLALDPGPEKTAYVLYDTVDERPIECAHVPNSVVRGYLRWSRADALAIEAIASYGMAVGAEVFSTCIFVGRFAEIWDSTHFPDAARLLYRREVKLHLCGSAKAKDPNVRQALIDKWGGKDAAIGKKASPGPLYGLTGDCWAALAVAVTAAETEG